MENFNQIFTLLAENEGIGLNLDILETGVLNIAVLVGILIYTGKDFLGSILQERKSTIVKSVQDAEDRLNEANRRLSEAQKQLSQAHVVISEIRNETITAKTNLLKSDATIAKKELTTRFSRAIANFRSQERLIFLEVKQQIISLVLQRSATQAKETFASNDRGPLFLTEILNENAIFSEKLKGDLL
jgi:F-type H+-transporting ATPase subunit b